MLLARQITTQGLSKLHFCASLQLARAEEAAAALMKSNVSEFLKTSIFTMPSRRDLNSGGVMWGKCQWVPPALPGAFSSSNPCVFLHPFFYMQINNCRHYLKSKPLQNISFMTLSVRFRVTVEMPKETTQAAHSEPRLRVGNSKFGQCKAQLSKKTTLQLRRCFQNDPFLPNNLSFDEQLLCNKVRLVATNPSWTVLH